MAGQGGQQLGFDTISDEMPTRLSRVTPARLAAFDDCPRRYRMAYVDRPTPPRGGAWAHSTLGATVHNALRAYFELPVPRRTPEQAAALVLRYANDEGFADSAQAARFRERAAEWVSDYVSRLDPEFTPVALERWVSATCGTIVAQGRVDRIDSRDGELVIVDYKTGRRTPGDGDAARSRALALYALATGKTMRQPCHRVELHHLPSGTVAAAEHDDDALTLFRERAEADARRIAAATDAVESGGDADEWFPAVTGGHCSSCAFRRSCPEGQAASEEIAPWALLAP